MSGEAIAYALGLASAAATMALAWLLYRLESEAMEAAEDELP